MVSRLSARSAGAPGQRLRLIAKTTAVGPSHALLEALLPQDWTAQQVYDHDKVMMLHGQRCCFYQNPACDHCVVLDLCPYEKARQDLVQP